VVAQFEAGPDFLHPEIRLINIGELGPGDRSRILRRLQAFVRDLTQDLLAPLRVSAAAELTPAARGLVYQLERNLGNTLVADAREQISALSERDRQLLNSFGISIGRRLVYSRKFLGASAIATRIALVAARYALPPELIQNLQESVAVSALEHESAPWWSYLGFHVAKPLAIRVDQYESLCRQFDHYATQRSFALPVQIRDRLACSQAQFEQLLKTLGFRIASGRCSARKNARSSITRCDNPTRSGSGFG
jgi:ATP-dependent RNA helicase SUPV3L1/SUV3